MFREIREIIKKKNLLKADANTEETIWRMNLGVVLGRVVRKVP
jgi:hypothetical protein